MPTYEYRCDACNHEFEEFQYIKDQPLKKCPDCGKNKLKRLISGGAAIVFKGSGFYQTDYRSDAYKKSAKADSSASTNTSSTSSGSSSKSDSSTQGSSSSSSSGTSSKQKGSSTE